MVNFLLNLTVEIAYYLVNIIFPVSFGYYWLNTIDNGLQILLATAHILNDPEDIPGSLSFRLRYADLVEGDEKTNRLCLSENGFGYKSIQYFDQDTPSVILPRYINVKKRWVVGVWSGLRYKSLRLSSAMTNLEGKIIVFGIYH